MAETKVSNRKLAGRNYSYNQLNGFRCKGCHAKAGVVENRTRVFHSIDCPIFNRLMARPSFVATLDMYRERWN